MGNYEAGTAFVQVVPSMRGFHRKVRQELKGLNDTLTVGVDADTDEARGDIKALARERAKATVEVDADTDRAQSKLKAIDRHHRKLDGQVSQLRTDVEGAERALSLMALLTAGLSAVGAAGPAAAAGLAAVPAAIGVATQGVSTLIVGFNGVGDAIKHVNTVTDEMGDATASQIDNMNDSMAQLTEEGRSFVTFFSGDFRKTMQGIGDSVQSAQLPHMENSLRELSTLAPLATSAMTQTAHTIGTLAEEGARMMTSGPWTKDFATIATANDRMIRALGTGGLHLADAFRSISVAALPMLEAFSNWIENQFIALNTMIQLNRETGALQVWFAEATTRAAELGDVFTDVGVGIWELLQALAPLGMGILRVVASTVEMIGNFAEAHPIITQVAAVSLIALGGFIALGRGIGGLVAALASARVGWSAFLLGMNKVSSRASTATVAVTGSAVAGDRVARATSRAATAFGRIGSALPFVGVAFAAVSIAMEHYTTSADEAVKGIMAGGFAAEKAREDLAQQDLAARNAAEGWNLLGMAMSWFTPTADDVNDKLREQYAAMGPLQRAQQAVRQATADHQMALQLWGQQSPETTFRAEMLAHAQQRLEWQQRMAADATQSHTDKIIAQRDVMLGAANADIAFRQSKVQVEQAQNRLNEAVAQYGPHSLEARDAQLALEAGMYRVIQAADEASRANFRHKDSAEADEASIRATTRAIWDMAVAAGDHIPPKLQSMITKMDASALSAVGAKVRTDQFGNSLVTLPNGKEVPVSAPGAVQARTQVLQLRDAINQVPAHKNITIHVDRVLSTKDLGQTNPRSGIPLPLGNADGRIAQYAPGGFAGLKPMDSIAQVVPPNTWRVVGDRLRDDEAYIPLNDSPRSRSILEEAARRMGFSVVPTGIQQFAQGGIGSSRSQTNTTINLTPDEIDAANKAVLRLNSSLLVLDTTMLVADASSVGLNTATRSLTSTALMPLSTAITSRVVPTLQLLQLHAGVLSVQSIQALAALLPPLQQGFSITATAIQGSWTRTSAHIGLKTNEIRSSFDSLKQGIRTVDHSFFLASEGIRSNWSRIRGYAHAPMRWVVDVVWNTGLLPIWNNVAGIFGQPRLNPVQFRNAGGLIHGGRVPGYGDKDTVPAMLTPGEFVLSKPAIDNLGGLDAVHSAHAAARRGRQGPLEYYNRGGAVGWPQLWGIVQRGLPGAIKTSDYRPGDPGLHGSGQALDFVTHNMVAASHWLARRFPQSAQLIHTPGANLLGGRSHRYNAATQADHWDHVHWALTGAVGAGNGLAGLMSFMDPRAQKAIDEMTALKRRSSGGINGFFGGRGGLGWPTLQREHIHTVIDGLVRTLNDAGKVMVGSGGGGFASANPNVIAAVRETAAQFGWNQGPQWAALSRLIEKESSWNPRAANPTSSARGLFQKMTSIHGAVEPTPGGQALWGLNYIRSRYGDPVTALGFHDANNWYAKGGPVTYDNGGVLPPGPSHTYNGTRKPEAVLTNDQMSWLRSAADGRGGGDIVTTVNARTDASPEHIAHSINRHVGMKLRA